MAAPECRSPAGASTSAAARKRPARSSTPPSPPARSGRASPTLGTDNGTALTARAFRARLAGHHALQLLPLLAWALLRWTHLDATTRARLLNVAGASYTAVVLLFTWQALRAQSVVRPDGETLAVAAVLAGLTAVATVTVLRRSRRGSTLVE